MKKFEIGTARQEGESTVWSVEIPADSAFFEGHFPGQPVLPAVGQFALIEELARQRFGNGAALCACSSMRFRAPIGAGARIDVSLRAVSGVEHAADERVLDCELTQAGSLLSRGRLRLAVAGRQT